MSTATGTDLAQTALCFHALSDETRLRIVEILGRGECCVCDLQSNIGAAQSRLSFHLRTLKDAGLVTDRREGRWNYYTLVPEALDRMAEYVTGAKPTEHAQGCAGAIGGGRVAGEFLVRQVGIVLEGAGRFDEVDPLPAFAPGQLAAPDGGFEPGRKIDP